jgi:hypothetical protein
MKQGHFAVVSAALLVSCLAPPSRAVNLVPNPSFETLSSCPTGFGQIWTATPWDAPNTGTTDAHNVCVTGWPPFPVPDVPSGPLGFQASRTGSGHAGIVTLNTGGTSYREYMEVPLTSPLVGGTTYTVSFYVNLSDSSFLSIDRIGAYLSVGSVGPVGNDFPLPFTPQVESPAGTFLTDTANWTLISGMFVAAGGEDHLVIGNYHNDANTATQPTGFVWPVAYYFVDDVSVESKEPELVACCTTDGFCQMLTEADCLANNWFPLPPGSNCSLEPCGATDAKRTSWGRVKTIYR